MGRVHSNIGESGVVMPTRKFRVTFRPAGATIEVDPQRLPYQDDGLPGSLLDIALGHGVEIEHACGGVGACGTCHVVVTEGFDTLSQADEAEEDELDAAPGLRPTSRLACRAIPNGTGDVVVEVPGWNRNVG